MPGRLPILVGDHQFRINGEEVPVYSGAVHYWRLERDKWDDILEKVKGMGFNTITSYIPWEVHEIRRGEFDFGQINPSNDIDAFITLVESKGMRMIVRPGPQINSELTWFGYPRRILEDPELQAKTAMGSKAILTQVPKPIPALNYACDKFFEETAIWFDAIMPILAKHAYPKGNLVAVQVDNEMAFFFHINPYECDFSADAIRNYQKFLQQKYGSLDELNSVYRCGYASFEEVQPPKRFEGEKKEDIPYYTDWIEYRERYLVDSLSRLADMMRARGLENIPLFHNYPHPLGPGGAASGITTPFNLLALEDKLNFVGFDIYSRRELYEHVKTVVSYVVGTSRFPFIPEFIAGVWPWYLNPGGFEDEEFVTKAALMNGIKGSSRYMIVERNRWLASPVRRDGRVRPDNYNMFKRVNQMALENAFVGNERVADVLLLANREYDRLEAASVLVTFPGDFLEVLFGFSEYPNYMTVSEKTLGFSEAVQVQKSNWFSQSYKTLTESGYQFLISDTDLPLERLKRYKALVLGSFEYMNTALQKKLVQFAEEGGAVLLGPRIPTLNERMHKDLTLMTHLVAANKRLLVQDGVELAHIYQIGKGCVMVLQSLDLLPKALPAALDRLELSRVVKSDPRLDVTIHKSPKKPDKMVVFVCNPTASPIEAEIDLKIKVKTIREIWEDRLVRHTTGTFSESLPAHKIMVYECTL
ncbi:MAG: beta-galactosidase [Anaerolineae bacterium]|nr:beta-galactosidase [Anaerolineae bacterium]